MASQPETAEIQSLLERLINSRNRDLSLFIPFLMGFSAAFPDPDSTGSEMNQTGSEPEGNSRNRSSPDESSRRERIILINPQTQSMVVVEGTGLDSMFTGAGEGKGGQPPASKSSVEALPCVEIVEGEDGDECVVCLDELKGEKIVKEMPCKHRFHGECVEKWLGIHGSCPVCRYTMPVEEKESGDEDDRRVNSEIWFNFFGRAMRRSGDAGDNGNRDGDQLTVDDHTVENGSD